MSTRDARILIVVPLSVIIGFLFSNLVNELSSSLAYDMLLSTIALILTMFIFLFTLRSNSSLPPPQYNVAIIGFPQSGKTTLIAALFGETFAQRIKDVKMTPRGNLTIERINEILRKIEAGQAFGPTKDQDKFSFRADVVIPSFPFNRAFKVEFGDFPGEDSGEYMMKYGEWLHNTEFFKWVNTSDSLVFVIDLGHYIPFAERKEFVSSMSSAIRAAWQHFLDANEHNPIRDHPVVLAFTKTDLCDVIEDSERLGIAVKTLFGNSEYQDRLETKVVQFAFGKDVPPTEKMSIYAVDAAKSSVLQDFEKLITYLEGETEYFEVVFTSSFGLVDGKRLGVEKLLKAVLPPQPTTIMDFYRNMLGLSTRRYL
jgi:GTPase SAR1 family protein